MAITHLDEEIERQEQAREKRKADLADHNNEPRMPAHSTARKIAGEKRVEAAMVHLREAREILDAACRDLCGVVGASHEYYKIRKLSEEAHTLHHEIDQRFGLEEAPYVLDREPTDDEIAQPHLRGCGKAGPLQ